MAKTLVIIPIYNEEANIEKLVEKLLSLNLDLDILVIDDGSDNSASLIKQKQTVAPNLFLIKRTGKLGRGSAVLEGFKFGLKGNYDFFVEMDADFSHQPEELPELLNLTKLDNVVIGSRYIRGSRIENWPLQRRIFSRIANWYANLVLGIGLHDYTNGYRVYGREAVKKLEFEKIESSGYIVLSEITYQMFKKGIKFCEHKILFINRRRGGSNFSWKEVKESFWSVWKLRFKNRLNWESLIVVLLGASSFIGIWHGLPMKDVINDELYFVGGVLRALEHHTILPQGVDVPYGTLTYILNYFLIGIFVLVLLFLFKFNLLTLKIYIFNSPSLFYLSPRIISAFLALGYIFLAYKIIKKEVDNVRLRIFILLLTFTNLITCLILHTGKVWVLNTFLLLLSFFFLFRVLSSEIKLGKTLERNIFLSVIVAFAALSNFILTPFALINIPILFIFFRKQKEIILKIIKYCLIGILLVLFINLLNYQGIKDQVFNAFRIHNESLSIGGMSYGASFFYSAAKILVLFPLTILTIVFIVKSRIKNKKLFWLSFIYFVTYFIYISLVTPWSANLQNGLRYSFPVGFFLIFILASFEIRFLRVFYLFGGISLLYFCFALYFLSAPTTYNQASLWLTKNLNRSDVVIVNHVDQLLLLKNKASYLLETEKSCYTRCSFVKNYNLNEQIKPLIIDQFSRADSIPKTSYIYYVEEKKQNASDLELIKTFGKSTKDVFYFSVDYNAGNYFILDYFKINNFGKNLYIYKKISDHLN